MSQFMKNFDEYKIWQKGLELAETILKMTDGLSSSGSRDVWSTLRKITFLFPSHLAEGFMTKNLTDRRDSFYRALNSLEEILKSLPLTEQMGHIKRNHIYKIKKDISELNKRICEQVRPQQRVLS